MAGKEITKEDKMIMVAYAGIALAYAILFVYKYRHVVKK